MNEMQLLSWQYANVVRPRAEQVSRMIRDRARQLAAEAGLDPNLLGIHPHNAMCAYDSGKPWPGIDYAKVKQCQHLLSRQFEPHHIADRWYGRRMAEITGNPFFQAVPLSY